jgi:NADPH-dependent curcumin reductase CurA
MDRTTRRQLLLSRREAVAVSAAVGAVGSAAGRLAEFDGVRVVLIAGGPALLSHNGLSHQHADRSPQLHAKNAL